MQFLRISSRTQLNTHTCYRFLAQVLDGRIKAKEGRNLTHKKKKKKKGKRRCNNTA